MYRVLCALLRKRYAVFVFYGAIALMYFALLGQHVLNNLSLPKLLIAPIMAFGSFVAGLTFLGGGSVAFPAMTKLMASSPEDAKTFSLAIQSVGMSAASLYIITRVRDLPWSMMLLYVGSASAGMAYALGSLADNISPVDLRIGFSLFLLCFLIIYLFTQELNNKSIASKLEKTPKDILLTLSCGFAGGLVSGLLGSGADVIGFSLMALYFRIELKRATQVSVILMAATAITGITMQAFLFKGVSEYVSQLWFVAAPVVLFGAPIGALFCRRIPRLWLLIFICAIVGVELATTLILLPIDPARATFYAMAALGFMLLLLGFQYLASRKHRIS